MDEDRRAAEQDSDDSIFEINDFTNATPWESFIADIEKVFHQWGLAHSDDHGGEAGQAYSSQKQHRKVERIEYAGRKFAISLEVSGNKRSSQTASEHNWAPAMHEMMDSSLDFPSKAHHISRWYGVEEFVLIMLEEGSQGMRSQAQANLLLGSVSIAVANTGCITPVFIQVHQPWRQMYVGVCEGGGGGVRTSFDMVHLRHPPPQFTHLSGLLELFKSKLRCHLPNMAAVRIAVRLTYVLKHWSLEDWPVEPLGDVEKEIDAEVLGSLPVGAISDPVQELHLSAVWPNMTEELIVDTDSHSDLKPMLAPLWTVRVILAQNPSCLLAEHLLNLMNLCYREDPVSQLLTGSIPQTSVPGSADPGYSHALDRLTEPAASLSSPFFSSVVYSASQRIELGGAVAGDRGREPLPDRDLEIVLRHMFPDAFESKKTPPTKQEQSQGTTSTGGNPNLVQRLKSAPRDSLTALLAKALCIINSNHGVKALCLVWYEVVQELRYRWENGLPIRNLPEGAPDMSCCLLQQKLQMLNCCIRHKLAHEQKLNTPHLQSHSQSHSSQLKFPETNSHSTDNSSTAQPTDSDSTPAKLAQSLDQSAEFITPVSSLVFAQQEEDACGGSPGGSPSACGGSPGGSPSGSEDEFYEALESQEQLSFSTRDDSTLDHRDSAVLEDREMDIDNEVVSGKADEELEVKHNIFESSQPQALGLGDSVESTKEAHSQSIEETHSWEETPHEVVEPHLPPSRHDGDMASERVGALQPCGDLVLITTGEPLYIPITQEHTPMTEDMLWEQERVLARLGTSEEAARVRAKMQSSSLISDIQAFKAANPECLLEDFVRWYSPRDWIEEVREADTSEPMHEQSLALQEQECSEIGERTSRDTDSITTTDHQTKSNKEDVTSAEGDRTLDDSAQEEVGGASGLGMEGDDGVKSAGGEAMEGEGWGEEWEEGWDFIAGEEGEGETLNHSTEDKDDQVTQEPQKQFVQGRLSLRMQQPNNAWVEAWQGAVPLPAYKQKRLFDDTREAEKVLHYLAGFKVCDLALSVMPMVLHAALESLNTRQRSQPLASVDSLLHDSSSLLSTIHHPSVESLPKYQECVTLLSQAEHLLASAHSLRTKLGQGLDMRKGGGERRAKGRNELDASVEVLLEEPELVLRDPGESVTGLALQGLLSAQVATTDLEDQEMLPKQKRVYITTDTFPQPSGHEFILRTTLPRPAPYSHPCPQRMFCVVTSGHFRLAGAFSTDTNLA